MIRHHVNILTEIEHKFIFDLIILSIWIQNNQKQNKKDVEYNQNDVHYYSIADFQPSSIEQRTVQLNHVE